MNEHVTEDPQLGALIKQAVDIKERLDEAKADGEAVAELKQQFSTVKAAIDDWQRTEDIRKSEEAANQLRRDVDSLLAEKREPSKAGLIGSRTLLPYGKPDPLKSFFSTLARARSIRVSGSFEASMAAERELDALGSTWLDQPSISKATLDAEAKATLGTTDVLGGYLVPNAVVSAIVLQATPLRSVVDLFQEITGIVGDTVDIPWEDETVVRAQIAGIGATKQNRDFRVNNYSASLYTLAAIADVSNQLLRRSGGAAEQFIRSKLSRAFALGEDYYVLSGSGSSEPYGLLTAIGTTGTYVSSFTPSATTLAGSVAFAFTVLAGAIANRGGIPDAAIMNSGNYWTMLGQGTDNSGFFLGPTTGPIGINAQAVGTTAAGPFGVRLRHSPNMTADNLVVGEFSTTPFFRGTAYRVDVSSEANTRWDTNTTGFRGEEDVAFDARPAVYTGHFQRATNIIA